MQGLTVLQHVATAKNCCAFCSHFSSVQDGICVLKKKHYALHPISQKFPQRCLWNGSNVRLIDEGPLSSFQGRSTSVSSFHASLLQVIDGVMSLVLCLQVMSEASQHLDLLRSKPHSAWFLKVLLHAVCCVTVQVAVCCVSRINTVCNDSTMHYTC